MGGEGGEGGGERGGGSAGGGGGAAQSTQPAPVRTASELHSMSCPGSTTTPPGPTLPQKRCALMVSASYAHTSEGSTSKTGTESVLVRPTRKRHCSPLPYRSGNFGLWRQLALCVTTPHAPERTTQAEPSAAGSRQPAWLGCAHKAPTLVMVPSQHCAAPADG